MNHFDTAFLAFLLQNAPSSVLFTHALRAIGGFSLFKGLLPITIVCGIWFRSAPRKEWEREMIVATLISGFVALFVGRLLASLMPFRLRPIYNPDFHSLFPWPAAAESALRTWSAFPSDHAMLWASIATGIFLISRLLGVIAFAHCAIFICLPRLYLGLHYPTDVIGGAAIGLAITVWMTWQPVRRRFAPIVIQQVGTHPGVFYMFAFLLCFELVTMFDEPRLLAQSIAKLL